MTSPQHGCKSHIRTRSKTTLYVRRMAVLKNTCELQKERTTRFSQAPIGSHSHTTLSPPLVLLLITSTQAQTRTPLTVRKNSWSAWRRWHSLQTSPMPATEKLVTHWPSRPAPEYGILPMVQRVIGPQRRQTTTPGQLDLVMSLLVQLPSLSPLSR